MTANTTIGARLKTAREALGLTQMQFAALAGCSKRAQIKWERGETTPNAAALAAFGAAGVNIGYVVTGVASTQPAATNPAEPTVEPGPARIVRDALAMLAPADRHRLLLDLLAGELRA